MTIDIVITWVDGDDPKHIAKRNQIIGASNVKAQTLASNVFGSINEISYCVKSILTFAPFVGTIFIVTDNQIPDIYYQYPTRIKIIDHKEIFYGYENVLPTINPRCIESLFYRIPGLSEHFVYFNDDFFLIKPIQPSDWFIEGKPVIRGRWEKFEEYIWYKNIATALGLRKEDRAGFRKAQSIAAKTAGFTKQYFRCYHTPRPLRKSTYEVFFKNNPELLTEQIKYRTRSANQFNPYSLMWHLEVKQNTAIIATTPALLELHHPKNKSITTLQRMLSKAQADPSIIFMNIQDLNLTNAKQQELIIHFLNEVICNRT
jgi:hypothetical protein